MMLSMLCVLLFSCLSVKVTGSTTDCSIKNRSYKGHDLVKPYRALFSKCRYDCLKNSACVGCTHTRNGWCRLHSQIVMDEIIEKKGCELYRRNCYKKDDYVLVDGVDCYGHGIGHLPSATQKECLQSCSDNKECKSVQYNTKYGCFLKNYKCSEDELKTKAGGLIFNKKTFEEDYIFVNDMDCFGERIQNVPGVTLHECLKSCSGNTECKSVLLTLNSDCYLLDYRCSLEEMKPNRNLRIYNKKRIEDDYVFIDDVDCSAFAIKHLKDATLHECLKSCSGNKECKSVQHNPKDGCILKNYRCSQDKLKVYPDGRIYNKKTVEDDYVFTDHVKCVGKELGSKPYLQLPECLKLCNEHNACKSVRHTNRGSRICYLMNDICSENELEADVDGRMYNKKKGYKDDYVFLNDVDCYGHVIIHLKDATLLECLESCSGNKECKSVQHNTKYGCFLKNYKCREDELKVNPVGRMYNKKTSVYCERPGRQCLIRSRSKEIGLHGYGRTRQECEDACTIDTRCQAYKYDSSDPKDIESRSLCNLYTVCELSDEFIIKGPTTTLQREFYDWTEDGPVWENVRSETRKDKGLLVRKIGQHETCETIQFPCHIKYYEYTVKQKVKCPGYNIGKKKVNDYAGCKSACDRDCDCKSFFWRDGSNPPNCWLKNGVCPDGELIDSNADYYIKNGIGNNHATPPNAGPLSVPTASCKCKLFTTNNKDLKLSNFVTAESDLAASSGRWISLSGMGFELSDDDDGYFDVQTLDIQIEAYIYPTKPTWTWNDRVTADTDGLIGAVNIKTRDSSSYDATYTTTYIETIFPDGQANIYRQSYSSDSGGDEESSEERVIAFPLGSDSIFSSVSRFDDGSFKILINSNLEGYDWSVYFNKNEVQVIAPPKKHDTRTSEYNEELCGSCFGDSGYKNYPITKKN